MFANFRRLTQIPGIARAVNSVLIYSQVVEFETPQTLCRKADGAFATMLKRATAMSKAMEDVGE